MRPLLPIGPLLLFSLAIAPGRAPAENAERRQPRIVVEEINPFSGLDFHNDPDHFQFAIVTDRTGGHRPGVFEDAVRKLNLLQPEFVMSVGDLIEGYTEDPEQLDLEWREFNGFIGELEMPFFYVPGNHDYSNEVMAADWQRRFGRSYYHFVYRDVLFLCLNSEGPPPSSITDEQIDYAERVLADNEQIRWTLVFVHKPLWVYDEAPGWARLEALLAGRQHTVFAGHFHTYTKYERNDGKYFVLATTGGGSGLRGPLFGQFDHVVWVTMTPRGPLLANLMLEGVWDEDVRTEETAGLIDAVLWGGAVVVQPIFAENPAFKSGTSELRLKNDADVPLQIAGRFVAQTGLEVAPASFERLLPPNSLEKVVLEARALKATRVEDLTPVVLEWSAQYPQSALGDLKLEGRSSLVVDRVYTLPSREAAVVVDGNLDEWQDLPFAVENPATIEVSPESWQGPQDCSFRFAVELGQEYLYIAVQVTDERPVYRGVAPWQQDGIEVRIDGRPDPDRSAGRGANDLSMADFVFAALSPHPDPAQRLAMAPERLAELGVKAACAPTPTGHSTEIAVPRAYFEERQGPSWKALRLNIAVDDFDEEQGPLAQIWWRPDWRDQDNYPGSGTFQRE